VCHNQTQRNATERCFSRLCSLRVALFDFKKNCYSLVFAFLIYRCGTIRRKGMRQSAPSIVSLSSTTPSSPNSRSQTHCNTLLYAAIHCSTLRNTSVLINDTLLVDFQVATHCKHTATQCNTLQHAATDCSTLQHAVAH